MNDNQPAANAGRTNSPLVDLVRRHHDQILARWLKAIQDCAPTSRLTPQELVDHLPTVLDRLETTLALIEANNWAAIPLKAAEQHALHRLGSGFDLREVVTEFFLLRHVLSAFVWEHRDTATNPLQDAQNLGWTIDLAIREAVEAYTETRQNLLEALDRLSCAALESRSIDEVLPRLLHVIVDMTADVDTIAVFLAEGDGLVFRAAVGIEEAVQAGFRIRMGEGIAGRVAVERRPMHWSPASEGPPPRSPPLLARGVRVLYALPLVAEGELLGVLQMASLTVSAFSDRDEAFLRATADRVAAAVLQHKLREEAEQAAKRQEELAALLDSIYAAAPVGFAFLDRDLRFVRANAALASMTGIPVEARLGKRPSEVLAAFPGVHELEAEWRRVMETGQPKLDAELVGRLPIAPERDAHFVASWYPVRVHDQTVGLAIVMRDVTAQRENELFQQRVLGIVGHDMRTPLSAIKVSAEVLLHDDAIGERQARAVARIHRSVARLEGIVGDLTDLTRTHGGHTLPIDRRPMDLAMLCHHVIEEVEAAHPGCRFELTETGDAHGMWDPGRLAQLLANLLGNAATYRAPDSTVAVRCLCAVDEVGLEVENHGPPISPELAPHIFEPFRRGPRVRDQGRGGLGLGLFIAREIVHAHGGGISFDSDEQRTVFRVRLPRQAT